MAQSGSYREELDVELKHTDPNSHASRLIAQEIDRLTKGEDEKKERPTILVLDVHPDRPQKCSVKVRIPVKEHPKYNFVGKLLGPKGQTLKALQDQTGCRMAIMGKGSMREKEKEEELRKEGGKYAHLNEDLHILVECYSEITDGFFRLAGALAELKKFVNPNLADDMYVYDGGEEMGVNGGGAPRGRGTYRGGPPERGGRGGFRGRGGGPVPPPRGRGAPPSRGPRGAPRGAPSSRGAPPSRGARTAAATPATSYDNYSSQAYGSGYESYDDSYGQNYSGQDSSYYDYGAATSDSASGYDSYSGGYGYGDSSWSAGGKAQSSRGNARSHPYSRPATTTY